ncbi:MAG TPA: hypothetical protein VFE78_33105 [Gemmataceae bacterium]|nr:hypothetical protein [Gemmataceae bacterium]
MDSAPLNRPPAEPEEFGQDVELTLAKDTFVEGEPVEIKVVIRNRSALPISFSADPDFQFDDRYEPAFRFTSATVQMDPLSWMWYLRIALNRMRGPPIRTVLPGRRYDSVIYLQSFTTRPGVGTHEITYDARKPVYCPDPTMGPEEARIGGSNPLQGRGTLRFVVRPARPGELEQIAARYAARLKRLGSYAQEALCVMDHLAVIPHLPELIAYCDRGRTWGALDYYANNEEARAVLRKALATADQYETFCIINVLGDWKCDVDVALLRKLSASSYHMRCAVQEYARHLGKPEYFEFIAE